MPDDEDYKGFGRLLAAPASWSENDARTMQFSLEQQRDMLRTVHPLDHRRRRRLEAVVDEIEEAIAQWAASKRST